MLPRVSLCVLAMLVLGCAQVSGLSEFDLDATGGGGGSGGAGGTGGTGGTGSGVMTGGGGEGGQPIAAGPFGGFQPVPSLASPSDDDDPTFTADGLELFFNTNRGGNTHVWSATRLRPSDDWSAPFAVPELYVGPGDSNGVVAPDGETFWMVAEVPSDTIHVSRRNGATWPAPVVDAQQDDPAFGFVGAVDADLVRMVYAAAGNLYEAVRGSTQESWGAPTSIGDLGSGAKEAPWMSPDGRHLYWSAEGRIYRSQRPEVDGEFAPGEPVDELDPIGYLTDPWLNPDQSYIMFAVGEGVDREIYEARRPKP